MDMEFAEVWPVINLVMGIVLGGGGAAFMIGRANASKPLKDSVETMLYESVPIKLLEAGYQVVKVAEEVVEFAGDVLDGKPNLPPD
jgi:hypothetical protein